MSTSIRIFGMAAGLSILLPLAAFADPATPASPAPATTAQTDPVVCHYYYYEGTVIKRPDCRTQHQWDRQRLTEQRYFREFQVRALSMGM